MSWFLAVFFFFQAEDGIRDYKVTGVQTCALPIWLLSAEALRRTRSLGTQPLGPGAFCMQEWMPASNGNAHSTNSCERSTYGSPKRSEEHTSELQSPCNLVCPLLLEKKKFCPVHLF